MSEEQTSEVNEEALHAFFDGELDRAEQEQVERAISADPAMARELEDLGLFRDMLTGGGESSVAHVPDARFEHELSLRAPAAPNGQPPQWPTFLLRQLCRYQITSGRELRGTARRRGGGR